ncbi:hypothetical protein POM88_039132 [Heracleum sosnowskyi]|uniref:Uncharacterized protein n=1 Tax=Heracleum sosnowskyi TaxID=360622 RepID=A0AAD8M7I9_9APIA|nr:hypothetical protein POM88_039132 [Heracleum sosnowskyi]
MNLLPFLGPLVKRSSETYRNFSVIKSLRENENLQVKDELYKQRKTVVKITGEKYEGYRQRHTSEDAMIADIQIWYILYYKSRRGWKAHEVCENLSINLLITTIYG